MNSSDRHDETEYQRYRNAFSGRRLPLAFVDLDRFDENAKNLASRGKGKPIRLASKSLRCRKLIKRALSRDGFRGVMAFTGEEASFLADSGIDDILVAYPTVDRNQVEPVLERLAQNRSITLTVDDAEQVVGLGEIAEAHDTPLPLCIDVDMSLRLPGLHFGVRRSPIVSPAQVVTLAARIRNHRYLRLDGLLGYEAQLAGLSDTTGRRAFDATIRLLKAQSSAVVRKRRRAVVTALQDAGHTVRFVNGGGTGSLEFTTGDSTVTELSAGSGLFGPTLFDGYRAFQPKPAAGFALPVTRRPAPHMVTCLGGGYVGSGAPGRDRLPTPWLPSGFGLLPHEGAGEVQTPLTAPIELALGDPVLFRHAKAGELAERFTSLLLVQGDQVVDEVPTYRGEGHAFV